MEKIVDELRDAGYKIEILEKKNMVCMHSTKTKTKSDFELEFAEKQEENSTHFFVFNEEFTGYRIIPEFTSHIQDED